MSKAKVSATVRAPLLVALAVLAAGPASAAPAPAAKPDLSIASEDVRIAPAAGGGYDLFVRAKPGIASVLLTESTKDPAMKADNFAYRALEYNPVNGDERRILNGQFLTSASSRYSLVSSTARPDPRLGRAFRIFIPPVLQYGYPWSRSGTVAVGRGTYINIRTFSKPYADYAGAFMDNPYSIAISYAPVPEPPKQVAPPPPPPPPPPEPPKEPIKAEPPPPPPKEEPKPAKPVDDSVTAKFGAILEEKPRGSLDLVLCLDTTESMVPYFNDIKKGLGPLLRSRTAGYTSFRIGIVLYKDYWPDEYITRKFPFTTDIAKIEGIVASAVVYGGADVPEALFEALHSAATEFDWSATRRQIIFLTDAPPHPNPKGKLLLSDVLRETRERSIEIDSVVVPDTIKAPNPPFDAFENVRKAIRAAEAKGGKPLRALVLAEGRIPRARPKELEEEIGASLAKDPALTLVGFRELPEAPAVKGGGAPWFAAGDAAAIKAALQEGAGLLLLCSTLGDEPGAGARATEELSQTVYRLIDPASGKELARDVSWRVGMVTGDQALFLNGQRQR